MKERTGCALDAVVKWTARPGRTEALCVMKERTGCTLDAVVKWTARPGRTEAFLEGKQCLRDRQ